MMKYVSLFLAIFIMSLSQSVSAQEIKEKQVSTFQKKTVNDRYFVMTVKDAGIYTVKVLNPRGEIQTTPIRKKNYASRERLEFKLKTKFWMEGLYHIIVESDGLEVYTKKFRLKRPELKH